MYAGNTMQDMIFYSWQSDVPTDVNRNFILRALEVAVKELQRDKDIEVMPVIDRDTMGVPGSPDITSTILGKIEKAKVFVCDVSPVTTTEAARRVPNPNVLIELGYAMAKLGLPHIVMVMNTAFGVPEDLPFDIRANRTLVYSLGADDDKAATRAELTNKLKSALRAIFIASLEAPNIDGMRPPAFKFMPDVDPKSQEQNIVFIPNIIDTHYRDIERFIGKPYERAMRRVGSAEEAPQGGETRDYHFGPYELSITYDLQGIAKGVHLTGLEQHQYQLDDWFEVLFRMGVSVGPPPDGQGITTVYWLDYYGLRIKVAAARVGGAVSGVRVYKLHGG